MSFPVFNVNDWDKTTNTNNSFEVLYADNGNFNKLEAKSMTIDKLEVEAVSKDFFESDSGSLQKGANYIQDILPIGKLTNEYSGVVNSAIAVRLFNENGDATNEYRIICLEWNPTKTAIRGAIYDTNGSFLSATEYFNITNSAFNNLYGQVVANPQEPYFLLDYNNNNTHRILIFYNTLGVAEFDTTPYPMTGLPTQENWTSKTYINETYLPKRVVVNPYLNTLQFFTKNSNITTDNLVVNGNIIGGLNNYLDYSKVSQNYLDSATYTVPSSKALSDSNLAITNQLNNYLPLSGGVLDGTLNGTNTEMFSNLAMDYQVKSGSGLVYQAGLRSNYNENEMDIYAEAGNATSKINGLINFQKKAELSTTGLKLLDDVNCHLKLQSGSGNESRIYFGDSSVENKGEIAYDNFNNSMKFKANSSSNPVLTLKSTDVSIGVDTIISNNGIDKLILGADGNQPYIGGRENNDLRILSNYTERIRVKSGGNVGIGTSSPDSNLTIGPSGVNASGLLPGVGMLSTATANRHYAVGQTHTNNVYLKWAYNATVANGYGTVSTYGGNNPLVLQEGGGNVGVHTTTPTEKFMVNGNIATNSASQYVKSCGFMSNNPGLVSDFGASDLGFVALAGSNLALITSGSEKMRVSSGGNVGIGTTNPFVPLTINAPNNGVGGFIINKPNGITTDGQRFIGLYNKGNVRWNLGIQNDETNPTNTTDTAGCDFHLYSYKNDGNFNTSVMTMTRAGNVGIGTNSPSLKLHVAGDAIITQSPGSTNFYVGGITHVSGTRGIRLLVEPSTSSTYMDFNSSKFFIRGDTTTAGTSRITIDGFNGNVGINTTTPSERLHVIGNILASGTITPSDIRIKENIIDANTEDNLNHILALEVKHYDYTEDYSKYGGQEDISNYGFIAQQVETVIPNAVKTREFTLSKYNDNGEYEVVQHWDDFKIVNKDLIFTEAVGAIQELHKLYKANLDDTQKLIQKVEYLDQQIVGLVSLREEQELENQVLREKVELLEQENESQQVMLLDLLARITELESKI